MNQFGIYKQLLLLKQEGIKFILEKCQCDSCQLAAQEFVKPLENCIQEIERKWGI